ncbi:hypothetical protein BH23CHL2_BH23CHL2_08820 [soil metagenome]
MAITVLGRDLIEVALKCTGEVVLVGEACLDRDLNMCQMQLAAFENPSYL